MTMAKKLVVIWIIMMFLITFTCSLTYLVAQQTIRLGANESPAQLAKDTAVKLQNGESPHAIVNGQTIDLSTSLSPFVMIYDQNKNLLDSSGRLDGRKPAYPKGVLENTAKKGENRVTWQTPGGLRFATVALKTYHGYVVAARSLKETENLEDHIGNLVLSAWAAALIFSTIAMVIVYTFLKKVLGRLQSSKRE